jgi:hypothetical protein
LYALLVEMIAFSNSAPAKTVRAIFDRGAFDAIFGAYNPQVAAQLQAEIILKNYWHSITGIRFKSKVVRMIQCAQALVEIQKQHGSFLSYLKIYRIPIQINVEEDLVQFWSGFAALRKDLRARKMPYLGNFTSLCHLFLELGYDCAKPDSAVMKAANVLGWISQEKRGYIYPESVRRSVVECMQRYGIVRQIRVSVVDLYLLIHGQQTGARHYIQPDYYNTLSQKTANDGKSGFNR